MFFTREDILKIQQALLQLGVKDSELPSTEYVTYDDTLSIVQDGKNKKIEVKDFFNQISLWKKEDFLNITDKYDKHYISLRDAINLVPVLQRKDGLVITFQDTNGDWRIYQFRGNIIEFLNKEKWFDLYDYRNYIVQSIVPDEEDLTASTPDENGNSLVHLKDRVYNPTIFNGKGYKFIRKNIINIELATIKISVTNPTTLEGDIYFNINNKGTTVHLSPTIHNTTKLVAEAIKDALVTSYNDYKVTVTNSVVTLTRKYSGNTSPTTFEIYNTGVRVIVEDYTTISERNIITQEDINKADTIYEIRYNFDLDGKTIIIPKNCVLYFTSGKFYNGSINMDNTIVSTLYEDILSEININGSYYNIQEHIKNHQSQLDDKQSQIDDKQQQITANDEDISLLQTRSTQMEETIESIAATGGASQATAVTYNNEKSKLTAINIQSAVDEIVDKAAIKDEKGTVIETPLHYIQNEEFIFAKVDAEDRLLFGIQWDGTPKFCKTSAVEDKLQSQVNLLADKITTILGDNDTTSAIDTLKELKDFFANIDNTQTLTSIIANLNSISTKLGEDIKNLQDTKVDKEEGKSLIEDEVKECFRVIENEEFIKAIVDSDDKVLFGLYRATGKPYYPLNEMYHVIQNEEFLWVILDVVNHPLLGIQQDGTCWAAKAQWLDDIKAINDVISSIDETIKTFQPKEDGKGLINLDVADSFFYISNDEYIIAVVDAENRIIAGIKYDAQPYFPNHEMYSVITNEEWLYAIIDAEGKVLCGFRADDGHMFVGGIDISTFITNTIIDIADIKERTAHISTIENDEYLSVETDADGKVIGYIATDGSHYLYNVKSETIPEEFEHIEDPEGRTEITTDAEDKVMSYRDADGKKHEHDMEVTNLDVSNINLKDNSVNNIQDALKANGFKAKTPIDWSENSKIQIPEPRLAIVNITNIDYMPTSKGQNMHAIFEFWDMQGNYFKKKVILDAQGNSSLGMPKKNFACDFCNDDWIGDDTFKIKFGNWVPQDSFHFKAFYADFFKGVSMVGYKLFNEIEFTRSSSTNRIWKRALLPSADVIGYGTKGMESFTDMKLLIDNGARCYPDGFPCIVHLNGSFYGIFSWALKKHRDNYMQNKSKPENIQLDGDIYDTFMYNGNIDWDVVNGTKASSGGGTDGFEFRNPKSLICIDGTKYDADNNRKELIDSNSEHYNASNKNHVNTNKVKGYYKTLTTYIPTLKKMEEQGEETSAIRNKIQSFFDIYSLIDYLIFSDVTANFDGFRKNWQWITYNGIKWAVSPYDLDGILGWSGWGEQSPTLGRYGNTLDLPTGWVIKYFDTELCERYKTLRANILTAKNIFSLLNQWCSRIGASNFEKDLLKWPQTSELYPPFGTNHYDNIYRVENWLIARLKKCDEIYKFN